MGVWVAVDTIDRATAGRGVDVGDGVLVAVIKFVTGSGDVIV